MEKMRKTEPAGLILIQMQRITIGLVPVPAHEELEKLKSYDVVPCISVSPWDTEAHTRRCLEEGYGMFICNYPSNAKQFFEKLGLR